MATKNRVLFCGATYHVMARGNRKQAIFTDARDRRQFLKIVAVGLTKFGAQCYGYSLMGNHFHLVVQTPDANLDRVMHHVDSLQARYVNWRHRVTGHLFEGPYTAIVIDDTCYLRNAIAYVLRNPVEANLVKTPDQWPWSSYNATMGNASPGFLTLTWLPLLYPAPTLEESRALLAAHVAKEQDDYADLVRAVAEGGNEFKRRARAVIGATLYRAALPRAYRVLGRPSLSELFADTKRAERRAIILRAHIVHGYLLSEIAGFLELHPTTISRIVNQSGSYRLIRD
jgi:putative transposase